MATQFKKTGVIAKMKTGGQPRDVFVSLPRDPSCSSAVLEGVRRYAADHTRTTFKGAALFRNKLPSFDGRYYRLQFGGRVKVASVKNIQLVSTERKDDASDEDVVLQFGKVSDDVFHLDYHAPFSGTERPRNGCAWVSAPNKSRPRSVSRLLTISPPCLLLAFFECYTFAFLAALQAFSISLSQFCN